jgi:hypothetical protein
LLDRARKATAWSAARSLRRRRRHSLRDAAITSWALKIRLRH